MYVCVYVCMSVCVCEMVSRYGYFGTRSGELLDNVEDFVSYAVHVRMCVCVCVCVYVYV